MRTTSFVSSYARVHILVWLSIALVPAVGITVAVTRAYRNEQRALAADWKNRGQAALASGHPVEAIEAFRNALVFSREDRLITLRLAQALAEVGRSAEARAYLLALWDEQPGNGEVNLVLARLDATRRDLTGATRYYHIAIEGAWQVDGERRRRAARLELADLLLRENAIVQAQSEAIALSADLPEGDDELSNRVAGLLLAAELPERARRLYERVLERDSRNVEALAGAGRSAFYDGSYAAAVPYLRRAVRTRAAGDEVKGLLDTARLVLAADPFARRVPVGERRSRVLRAFEAGLARLAACAARANNPAILQPLIAEAAGLRKTLTARALARDPELDDSAMDLVFRIESQTAEQCGPPDGLDRALLLIARQRKGTAP